MRTPGVAWLSALLWATGCLRGPAVTREVDGRTVDDRWISPEAYAAYTEAALLEEAGDRRGAALAYERALDEDDGGEIWARLGGVRCREDARASDLAFRRARAKGPELSEVWLSDAACALERGETSRARLSALRAAALAPERLDASLVVVAALLRTGARESAVQWLRATRLSFPEAAELDQAPEALFGNPAVSRMVSISVRAVFAVGSSDRQSRTSPGNTRRGNDLAELDAALDRGDVDSARRAAVLAHVGLAWVALRAAELGRPELARDTAELVLAAEPTNVEARVAALAAADLAGDAKSLRKWATRLPEGHDAPSAAAVRVMATLLDRRLGHDAARVFLSGAGAGQPQ